MSRKDIDKACARATEALGAEVTCEPFAPNCYAVRIGGALNGALVSSGKSAKHSVAFMQAMTVGAERVLQTLAERSRNASGHEKIRMIQDLEHGIITP